MTMSQDSQENLENLENNSAGPSSSPLLPSVSNADLILGIPLGCLVTDLQWLEIVTEQVGPLGNPLLGENEY